MVPSLPSTLATGCGHWGVPEGVWLGEGVPVGVPVLEAVCDGDGVPVCVALEEAPNVMLPVLEGVSVAELDGVADRVGVTVALDEGGEYAQLTPTGNP